MASEGGNRNGALVRASAQDDLYLVCRKVLEDHDTQGRPPTIEDLQQLATSIRCLEPSTYPGYSDNPTSTPGTALAIEPSRMASTIMAMAPSDSVSMASSSEEQQATHLHLTEGISGYLRMLEEEQASQPLIHRSREEQEQEQIQTYHRALLPNRDEENPNSALLVDHYISNHTNTSNERTDDIPKSPWLGPLGVFIIVLVFASGVISRDMFESLNNNYHCNPETFNNERQSLVHSCAAFLSGLDDDEFWDLASAQYRAANWFLGPFGHEVAVPNMATMDEKELCKWDSEFGMLYALMVVRESLAVHEIDWYTTSPSRVCHWPRIKCNDNGQVVNLIFNNAQLRGSLPAELAGLVHLEKFHAFTNPHLKGTIPSQLGSLSSLTSLDLHETGLEGSVPSEICQLREHGNLTDLLIDPTSVACSCCHADQAKSFV